jgi:hypothetical protein
MRARGYGEGDQRPAGRDQPGPFAGRASDTPCGLSCHPTPAPACQIGKWVATMRFHWCELFVRWVVMCQAVTV